LNLLLNLENKKNEHQIEQYAFELEHCEV